MLTGELVRLRPMEPSDAEALHRWNNDPEVVRWLDGYPQSLAHTVRRAEERRRISYDHVLMVMEILDSGRLIGIVMLRDAEPETGRAELDLYIGEKDCWGQGYGTDALRTICRYGFDQMRLHAIQLWVAAENAPAVRCYQKVGFRQDGRAREAFRRDGRWHDMLLMSLLEGELSG